MMEHLAGVSAGVMRKPLRVEAASDGLAGKGPVRIRLVRFGRKKLPYYRIIIANSRCRRDGRFLEMVGHYNPMAGKDALVTLGYCIISFGNVLWNCVGLRLFHGFKRILHKCFCAPSSSLMFHSAEITFEAQPVFSRSQKLMSL